MEMELNDPSGHHIVEQDGYISPIPSCSGDVQDFSSPLVPKRTPLRKHEADSRNSVDHDFSAEAVSSPLSPVKLKRLSNSTP
jgi:exonuclease-1